MVSGRRDPEPGELHLAWPIRRWIAVTEVVPEGQMTIDPSGLSM